MRRALLIGLGLTLASCDPKVCGVQRVGGGQLELILTGDTVPEPVTFTVPGAPEVTAVPQNAGAWLELGPEEGGPMVVHATWELSSAQVPCGLDRAALDVLLFWRDPGQQDTFTYDYGYGYNGEISVGLRNLTGAPEDGVNGPEFASYWDSLGDGPQQAVVRTSQVAGTVRSRGDLALAAGQTCSELPSGPIVIDVAWAFDPAVAHDTFYASIGRCQDRSPFF